MRLEAAKPEHARTGTVGSRPPRACALVLLVALGSACDDGSPAGPAFVGGEAGPAYAVCPTGMDASFGSIYSEMLSVGSSQIDGQQSCGANISGNCHSTSGSSASTGTGNLLDFSLPAREVYDELLRADGGLVTSANLAGDTKVARVVPFDAGASMLYIKLTLTTSADPMYGSGMPLTAPGSVCPAAVEVVKQWIDQGAVAGDLPVVPVGDGGVDGPAVADGGHDATVD